MAIFNQQGQSVGYQFNGETFHFDSARSVPAALSELDKLLSELSRAGESEGTDSGVVAQARAKVAEALAAARGPIRRSRKSLAASAGPRICCKPLRHCRGWPGPSPTPPQWCGGYSDERTQTPATAGREPV